MSLESLQKLFEDELKDVLSAERQITKALPKMAKAASSDELRAGFEKHLAETEGQIERLEQIFENLGKTARAKKCEGMEGLLQEGTEMIEEEGEPAVKDAALIACAQKVEHYEIASYGTLIAWAKQLELDDAVELLAQTLEEEKATDMALTELAEGGINVAAEE
jgi:ferritin-like metal-binding protein YciE